MGSDCKHTAALLIAARTLAQAEPDAAAPSGGPAPWESRLADMLQDRALGGGAVEPLQPAGLAAAIRLKQVAPDATVCLVEKGSEGLGFGANERKMGWHAQPTRTVT